MATADSQPISVTVFEPRFQKFNFSFIDVVAGSQICSALKTNVEKRPPIIHKF